METWLVSFVALGYLLLLFLIAYYGQKFWPSLAKRPAVYALCLGVSCTSWAFYGTISQAAHTGFGLAPIYIGTIACFLFAWPLLIKLLRVSKQQNLTSVADFIACRFNQAPHFAAIITIIAVIGTLPYIALQLRAVSQSFDLITGSVQTGLTTTLFVTFVLIGFSILFGARHSQANRQNPGLVIALAFSSLFKLFIILLVGFYVTFVLFDGWRDLTLQLEALQSLDPTFHLTQEDNELTSSYFTFAQVLIGFVTIFVTPPLYHLIVIENDNEKQLKKAKWLYPGYLLLINVFVLPIAIAGLVTFPGGAISPDTFMLTLPLYHQQSLLSLLVFLGGLAAATSMVIVASIVLSTLITTEIANPILIKSRFVGLLTSNKKTTKTQQASSLGPLLLYIRRCVIAVILLLSLSFERLISQQNELASLGLLSFVLLAQCAPALIAALYWRQASSMGAMWGLIAGCLVWIYCLLIPAVWPNLDLNQYGLFGIQALKPTALFGLSNLDWISHGLLMSLAGNVLTFLIISKNSQRTIGERLQANLFIQKPSQNGRDNNHITQLTYKDLTDLVQRFVDTDTLHKLKRHWPADINLSQQARHLDIQEAQKAMSSVLGSASTRLVLSAVTQHKTDNIHSLEHVANIVDEASRLYEFNRELLQAGVENIAQGISVINSDMQLVAWNSRYIELLDFPPGFLVSGMPIEKVIRFNAQRDMIQGSDTEAIVKKRLDFMRRGQSHNSQRTLPSGIVIEIRGQAMPGGGFVSTYTDITAHIQAEQALKLANETLEKRVEERTAELSLAKAEAEAAYKSKTRFLAAASHDLMQPFNALSLFTSMLKHKADSSDISELAENIEDSLQVVEDLLSDLVQISKLDNGNQKVDKQSFALNDVLIPLKNEFTVLANQLGVSFSCHLSSLWVHTDKRMLRRILQNFLANAFHYAPSANEQFPHRPVRIVLGVRRTSTGIQIQVHDNGKGIPNSKLTTIFKEFERLEQTRETPGLGLGLAICERISALIDCPIHVHSNYGKGVCFGVELVSCPAPINATSKEAVTLSNEKFDTQKTIAVIDNEPLIVTALKKQLENWGFEVIAAQNKEQLLDRIKQHRGDVDLVLADYHLDNDETGLGVINAIKDRYSHWSGPVIICSADPSETLRQTCIDNDFGFIRKPVKGPALKKKLKTALQS